MLGSLTRPAYAILLLSIIGAEFFFYLGNRNVLLSLKNILLRSLPLLAGTAIVVLIQLLQHSGRPFKFLEVQKYWGNALSLPHHLRDWSKEGFAINIGVIFMLALPMLVVLARLFVRQLNGRTDSRTLKHTDHRDYLLILSVIYLLGNTLFIILFRGGSLHCLFRFTLCSPFFYVLLFIAHDYIRYLSPGFRMIVFSVLSVLSIFVLHHSGYSGHWRFSFSGLFILAGGLFLWLFQDKERIRFYRTGMIVLVFLNLLWTTYLFNTYINDGWIFA